MLGSLLIAGIIFKYEVRLARKGCVDLIAGVADHLKVEIGCFEVWPPLWSLGV
ncbi:hypothetical protein ACVI1K_003510 [Bradyrhizobium sp. USDA 4508]